MVFLQVHNVDILNSALDACRCDKRALVTVSNHHCCLDDPLLFGAVLQWTHLLDKHLMRLVSENTTVPNACFNTDFVDYRWSLAAHDVCFTQPWHGWLFARGKIVPVVRGWGVHQPGVDFCMDKINRGQWVHVFPEGKVNLDKKPMRFKWGVGRLAENTTLLPMWHLGMDEVLPNQKPYLPRILRKVTVLIGEPVSVEGLEGGEVERRKALTDRVQEAMKSLERRAIEIHAER